MPTSQALAADQSDTDPTQEAERHLISALLDNPRLLETIDFNPTSFQQPIHQAIWEAATTLHNAQQPVDPVTIADEASRQNPDKGRLNPALLHAINGLSVVATSGHHYAGIVTRESQRRRVLEAGHQIITNAHTQDPQEVLEQAQTTLDGLQHSDMTQDVSFIDADLDETIESLERPPTYIPTPWWSLNEKIGGFIPGALYAIGARPASGKSIFGLQAALTMAQHGSVAYISMEMSRAELHKRMLSNLGDIDGTRLQRHRLSDWDWDRIAEVGPRLKTLPISILDRAVEITQMHRFIRSVHRKRPLAGIVVDHMGLINPPHGDRRSKYEYISAVSRELKRLAMDMDVPVLALAQLNREVEKREGGVPRSSDLRDSGSIEADSDAVLLLKPGQEEHTKHEIQIIIGKNRRGSMGEITLDFKGYKSKFTEPGEPQ